MQKRRSHKKSRNGCQNCKKWHTKCDEQGPPCNNCALRKAKCVYSRPKTEAANHDHNRSLTIRSRNGETSTTALSIEVERPRGDVGTICAAYGGPSRLLELELMHQWSTTTYKAFCGIPEDGPYLQCLLPRCALEYDFMLNCIMAISSLHIAQSGGANSKKYINAGLEYYNKGSSSFRTHLGRMNADNAHVLYMFSAIAISVHLSIPQRASVIDLLVVALDLVNGSTSIGMMGMPWLLNSALPLRAFISRMGASKDLIDADSKIALARLRAINDVRNQVTAEPISSNGVADGVIEIRDHDLFEMAIAGLETCYAEEARGILRGFGTAFPGLAGKPFTSLVSKSDPFALLIISHWAVLLSKMDQGIWWVTTIADRLAIEISDLLKTSHPDLSLEWADAMVWVHGQMGISWSQSRELSYSSGLSSDSWDVSSLTHETDFFLN
ncbi:uncharacterized protein GGS22DRAFT_155247 [Annulohypoxylon maeteangense]|uniref:uncharacterized protein n=1 Tax=Annulohypoxylon maeteangense TaxID=1927788 RepID=UPI002007217A|nr:uncharacterized protein GGS22DRAFT_155247 [Annulohypoxylon maeteangense]KAI0888170.1 hypothetical protein GGS22DRAFT_155247 [Annulohypoxylon maeteangense]